MMPTCLPCRHRQAFPPPPRRFRTVGVPQYGSKASLSARACPGRDEVKPAPGIPAIPAEFASRLRGAGGYRIGEQPVTAPTGHPARSSLPAPPLTPGVLGSGPSSAVSACLCVARRQVPHGLLRPPPPVSQAPGDFTVLPLIPRAFAGRARRGDPRAVPSFPCRAVPAGRGPSAGGLAAPSRGPGTDHPRLPRVRPESPPPPRLCPQSPAGCFLSARPPSRSAAARRFASPSWLAPTPGNPMIPPCLLRPWSPSLLPGCLPAPE